MVRSAPLAALSLMTLPALVAPAHAQQRIVRRDLGFSFVMPGGYDFSSPESVPKPYTFRLSGPLSKPTTLVDSPNYVLNRYLIAGIMAGASTPDPSKGEGLRLPNSREFEALMDELRQASAGRLSLNFQGSADITLDSVPAKAYSVAFSDPVSSSGMRMLFAAHGGRLYMFVFGCVDAEFPGNAVAFEKMMASLRWLDREGLPPIVEPKPAPKKPAGKKKA